MNSKATESTPAPEQVSTLFRLRIYTFGPFRIEWIDPATDQAIPFPAERLSGQNAANSLALLLALLSKPGRFATRSWLLEQFWPMSPLRSAEERLNDVASALRCLLRAEGDKSSFVHFVYGNDKRGAGYRLESYPRIWCDADAFEWFIHHALLLEQRGQDATACWERAYALSQRGEYLPEQIEQDWSRQRRDALQGLQRDCVQHWTQQLRQAGQIDEAILRLRSYWLEHPTDEDALRPLLEMLGERERFQEAEAYYAKACEALAEDEHIPDEHTNEAIEVVRALKIQRRPIAHSFARWNERNTKIAHEWEKERYQDIDPLRRATVTGLLNMIGGLAAPSEWWERLVSSRLSAVNTEVFLYVQHLLDTSWGLSNAGELYLAEQVLRSFLPRMLQLAPHKQEAASLAAEGLRLHGILAAHQQRMEDKFTICLQAVEYARQANNLTLLIAQLTELAIAFIYARQPANALKTYQEALSYCEGGQISPLVRARIYAAAAPTLARNGEVKKAYTCIEKAYQSFSARADNDPSTFSADNGLFMIDYYHGLLHLVANRPKEAYEIFEQTLTQPSERPIPERWRLIILNYQGLASILSHQFEQYARCLEEGISGSLALGSQKRLDEAVSIYQQHLPHTWHMAPGIKEIAERFQLDRESRKAEELEI